MKRGTIIIIFLAIIFLFLISLLSFGKITGFASIRSSYNRTCVYDKTTNEGPNKTETDPYIKAELNIYNSKTGKYSYKKPKSDLCKKKKVGRVYKDFTKEAYCVKEDGKRGRRDTVRYNPKLILCEDGCQNGACISEEYYNCKNSESIDFYISPTLTIPGADLLIYTKNPSWQALPTIPINIYDSNNLLIKTIYLYNDGQHDDIEAEDYINANSFSIDEVGDYYANFCGRNVAFEVRDIKFEALYPNHNDINADRINMILIGSGYESLDEFKEVAQRILSFDGKFTRFNITGITTDLDSGEITNVTTERKRVGFFATEPLKSNKDKFNIWYIDYQINGSLKELISKIQASERYEYFPFFNLSYVYPALIRNGEFIGIDEYRETKTRSHAETPNFFGDLQVEKQGIRFGMTFNYYPIWKSSVEIIEKDEKDGKRYKFEQIVEGTNTKSDYGILTHESGHALFGLLDEYYETGETTKYGYPQCAHNQSEAEAWWGDLIGQVDPFYYEYIEFFGREINENEIKVNFINGGCRGGPYRQEGVIRPTDNSIMKDYYFPVFGSVSRRRIEQVLNLFSGI